ncbi:MAG: LapA family protein [Pseudomonadota bacterium]|nr:LapA family protein [Pseudomonadota bacterium]
MSLRSVLLLVLVAALALFAIVNWAAFTTPTTLSLLVGSVEAPLGLIMLLITGFLAAVFLAYAFYLQTSALLETRRLTRELQTQRNLADQAEASRLAELRATLDTRFERLEEALRAARTEALSDLTRVTDEVRLAIDQAINGLAAQIAELDDHIARR